jgi:hypothetical protein
MIASPEQHPLRPQGCRAPSRLRWLGVWLQWTIALLASCNALAQTAPERAERAEIRELRRDSILTAQEIAEPRVADHSLLLGVAYTDAESGERRWATPFEFRTRFNKRRTYFKLSGDGYVVSRPSAEEETDPASGLANLNAGIGHKLTDNWRGFVGLTIPAHGEVGSKRGRERVSLSYEHGLWDKWSGLIKAQVVRFDADPAPDESRYRYHGLVQLAYNFQENTLALAQLERAHRPGVSSASAATFTYQMPIGRTTGGPLLGVVNYSRGLTEGLRDNTIEFDICLRF